ncbi:MAG: hypothetical protein HC812_15165 [Leptolyngbya sp. RL_3_1]|nr:hypothetical protein [Leptolyngbya sp. RL_3_1]
MFGSENQLQKAMASWLSSKGYYPDLEVPSKYGRIDILTAIYLIETKKELTRKVIREAQGQVQAYLLEHPECIPVIAGWTPADVEASHNAAEAAEANGVQVWYMDEHPEFLQYLDSEYDCHDAVVEDSSTEVGSFSFEDYIPSRSYTPSYGGDGSSAGVGISIAAVVMGFFVLLGLSNSTNNDPIRRYATDIYPNDNPKANLYHEVKARDVQGAMRSLTTLAESGASCDYWFAGSLYNYYEAANREPESLLQFTEVIKNEETKTDCRW